MLIELFIFFEVLTVGFFVASFFTRQEILWAITVVLSGVLAFTSWNVEYYVYEFNVTQGVYVPLPQSRSYGYLMAINLIFFSLGMILMLFDLFDKYGQKFASGKEKERYR